MNGFALHVGGVYGAQHSGFQAGKADIVFALHLGHGQAVGLGVTGFGSFAHAGAAGIGQAQCACHLVKRLTGGIVHRAAQHLKMGIVLHLHNLALPAAGFKTQKRGL